ncbi:endonuclease III domain-containing protein [Tundrisphaera sp. TA3]|uniref:endonuclease III domain-containing protein n=1 Tax=Tundrisphaera sp. TA3 TaxID=3435775 RepID=UPI003EBDF9D7
MATQSKAQFIADILALLKKRYHAEPSPERLSVLEAVVYGICHEDVPRARAVEALASFQSNFFDWNELRVSSLAEIQKTLEGIPGAEERATRIRRFLRQLFEKTYGFNLDAQAKKPQKEAVKAFEDYEAFASDYILATATRLSLGGHAIPVDASMHRALDRLGIAEPGMDAATLRSTLERAVPKARGTEFADLIEELAHDTCVPGEPDCPRCELQAVCPTGKARLANLPTSKAPKARAVKSKAPEA